MHATEPKDRQSKTALLALRAWVTLGMFAFGFGVGFLMFGTAIWIGTRSLSHVVLAVIIGLLFGLAASIGF